MLCTIINNNKPSRIIQQSYCICLNNPYIRLLNNGVAHPAIFCIQTRRIERKESERKEGLVGGIEAEAHIWVIGDDRPWIILLTTEPQKMEGVEGDCAQGFSNPMEFAMRHSIVAARKNSG